MNSNTSISNTLRACLFSIISLLLFTQLVFTVENDSEEITTMNVQHITINEPDLNFEKLTHDFGNVLQNQELQHIFTFTNQGKDTLHIENVRAT